MPTSLRLVLLSCLMLFVELALIRWSGSNVVYLSYFSNFVLLGSFLGIGIGFLRGKARVNLFRYAPVALTAFVGLVFIFPVRIDRSGSDLIYFGHLGTSGLPVWITLPFIFLAVAGVLALIAEGVARTFVELEPLEAYRWDIAGSILGILAFSALAFLWAPPVVWGVAAAILFWLVLRPNFRLLQAIALIGLVFILGQESFLPYWSWSPYYKITVSQQASDTVVEVNNIFHQSMAPVEHKEYFYQWPYMAFGETFKDVLILGSGSGTDVAAALRHGVRSVDAVEIDPAIIRLGRQHHPDRPYSDPRVTVINDDARHFLRTTRKRYDLVVFALIDSLTMQSSFSGVRLESYMFTEESFRAVRDRLTPDGVLVVYNYFREPWLVDRLANTAAAAFGAEPWVHVHEARAYLGVLMAGPRVAQLTTPPSIPEQVTAFGQSHAPSPARMHTRDSSIEPATDDWPFLYMRDRHVPQHYVMALAVVLLVSAGSVLLTLRGLASRPGAAGWTAASWQFFLLGAGFMLLETKSITQFALLWGSTWVVASLAIASVLTMALVANYVVAHRAVTRPWIVAGVLVALLAVNYVLPIGRVGFESRIAESLFYAALAFSPILCAGMLFGSAIARSTSLARDYGINLLGAMVGGVGEYLSLVSGFRFLLLVIALCYLAAVAAGPRLVPEEPILLPDEPILLPE